MAVIFMHIPKNGGKTVNSILRGFYPEKKTFAVSEITPNESNIELFYQLPEEQKKNFEILIGHVQFGIHEYFPEESKYFTFLRLPEDRIISFYKFVLRQPNHRLFQEVQSLNLIEFIQKVNAPDLHNGQIRYISGISDKEEFMLEKALENIEKHFAFVGTLEKFDESLLFLKSIFGWPYPFYTIRNKNQESKKTEEVPIKTRELIAEQNKGDMQLYEVIEARMKQKLRDTSNFKTQLKLFKSLNDLYSIPFGKKLIKKVIRTTTKI